MPHITSISPLGPQAQSYSRLFASLASNPQFYSILAVSIVFYEAPSPLQIGHVLHISWEDVRRILLSFPELFGSSDPPEHYYSEVHISQQVRTILSDPTHPESCVDLPRWHAFLARWCLNSDSSYDARYAASVVVRMWRFSRIV